MKDVMLEVYKALKSDSECIGLLGNGIFNNPIATDEKVFPRVTMFEISHEDDEFADDSAQTSFCVVRIDIWSKKNNLFKIAKAIKKAVGNKFNRCFVRLGCDMYEKDCKIYHKPVTIKLKVETEE